MNFDLHSKTKYPAVFAIGCISVLALSFFLGAAERITVTITLLTVVGGVTSFLYSKHSKEIQIFRELFHEFNERYDKLNENLNQIHSRPERKALEDSDIKVLYNYFNLCAEEYMYATAGYIDDRVWRAWQNGMCYFAKDPEILEFWRNELQKNDSYYGFTLDCIRNA